MRRFVLLTALVLLGSVCMFAQSGGDQTPPGGDMVGSDPHPASAQMGEQSVDAAQNQRLTGTYGNTKGYAGETAYAGSSDYTSRQNISSTGAVGQQEYTSTATGRRMAENRQSSPYDSGAANSQPYLSGQFGQKQPPQPGSHPGTNAKPGNEKPAPPKR